MTDIKSTPTIKAGLVFIDQLNGTERNAFLGLFAGARFPWIIYDDGQCPFIGKAECERVENWRDFYAVRLPAAGLFFWHDGKTGPALGMAKKENGEHHPWTRIACGPTELGWDVRDAWWKRWGKAVDARAEELGL